MNRTGRPRQLAIAFMVASIGGPGLAWSQSQSGDETWWSYRPFVRPDVPTVGGEAWGRNPIDQFILSRLEENGLSPAAPADRRTLIRRACYDLTGLPPTPELVEQFAADQAPDAFERLIDHLLASQHYGEKWGRHWLDLVRFAETDSYERDRLKPNAWKYRDYVINSFNTDKPYDRFIMEQLAGDEMEDASLDTLIATGYYRLGIWDDEPADTLQAQYDDLDGIVATTGQVMLGMSLNCARCHDHKRDPIPQADYYRFLAFFENIKPYKVGGGNAPTPKNYLKTVPIDLGSSTFEDQLRDYQQRRASLLTSFTEIREQLDPVPIDALAREEAGQPVLHLTFDETDDESATAAIAIHHGEIGDVTVGAAGRHGSSVSFDGAGGFIRIPRPVQNDFTISFWFKTTSIGPGGSDLRWFLGAGLVDGEVPGIVPDFGISYHSNGHITAGTGQPETFIHSPGGYNDDTWHHVAFTRQQDSGDIALFLDGEQVAKATGATIPLDRPQFLSIGRMLPGHRSFDGAIDDVRFYDRPLSQSDVLDLAAGPGFGTAFAEVVREELGEEVHRRFGQIRDDLVALRRPVQSTTQVLCIQERGNTAPESFIRVRGNANVKGQPVKAGFPSILTDELPSFPTIASNTDTTRYRHTLAEWIASPTNIRTARVMANRLWQYHFGRGISRTPNDFGILGTEPTHPQLLDWLAAELVEQSWQLKSMHKLIMMSSAYRMSSAPNPRALASDPQNNWFWRFDMRRLGAEEIRDSILAVNGTLNPKMGGPGVYPPMPEEVLATSSRPNEVWGRSSPQESARRSIYIHVKRSMLSPMLTSFDMADTDATCPVRFTTTQPTQALTMLNSDFMNEQAAILADLLRASCVDDAPAQLAMAIELVTQRPATSDEITSGLTLLRDLQADEGVDKDTALVYFCLVALNLSEFVYLD